MEKLSSTRVVKGYIGFHVSQNTEILLRDFSAKVEKYLGTKGVSFSVSQKPFHVTLGYYHGSEREQEQYVRKYIEFFNDLSIGEKTNGGINKHSLFDGSFHKLDTLQSNVNFHEYLCLFPHNSETIFSQLRTDILPHISIGSTQSPNQKKMGEFLPELKNMRDEVLRGTCFSLDLSKLVIQIK